MGHICASDDAPSSSCTIIQLHLCNSLPLCAFAHGTGLEAELRSSDQAKSSQAAELAALKNGAVASNASIESLQQELQSKTEQLQHAQAEASQLSAKHEQLRQECNEQTARCNKLQADLTNSGETITELQGRLQTETEALHAVQEELQGRLCEHASQHVVCQLAESCSLTYWHLPPRASLTHSDGTLALHAGSCPMSSG